jgi:hypothetical protein
MTDDTDHLPPRGWYPDPAGSPAWRWWDGARWTADTHAYVSTAVVPSDQLAAEEAAAGRLGRIGVPIFVVIAFLDLIGRVADAEYMAATVRWFRSSMAQIGTPGFVALQPPRQPLLSSLLFLPELVGSIVVLVLLCTAQHKMATVARDLKIRSRLSPNWGVVGWFIPLADFVLPLLAWHDLVPDGHPLRRQMSGLWAAYLASAAFGIGCFAASLVSTVLVAVLAVLALASQLIVARMLPGILAGVVAHHASAAGGSGHGAIGTL